MIGDATRARLERLKERDGETASEIVRRAVETVDEIGGDTIILVFPDGSRRELVLT